MRTPLKRQLPVFVSALAFLAIAVAAILPAAGWIGKPFAGFLVGKALNVYPIAATDWAFHSAGLRAKDQVRSVNGTAVADQRIFLERVRAMPPGTTLTCGIRRDDRELTITTTVRLFGFTDWLVTFGFFLVIAVVFLTTGLTVFFLKSTVDAAAVFALFCCTVGLFFLTYFDAYADINLVFILDIALYLAPALMIHLALIFPEPLLEQRLRRRIIPAAYILFLVLWRLKAAFELHDYGLWSLLDHLSDVLIFLAYLTFILVLLWRSRRSVNTLLRKRAQLALLGMGMAFCIPSISIIFSLHNGVLTHNYSFLSGILFPLYLGYAVVRHNFFNADRVVVYSVFYILFSVLLTVLFLVFASLTGLVFSNGITGRNILITVFFTCLVLAVTRLQHWGHALLARFFFRRSYDRETLFEKTGTLLRSIHHLTGDAVPQLSRLFRFLGITRAGIVFRNGRQLEAFCHFSLAAACPDKSSRATLRFLEQHGDILTPFDLRETPLPTRVGRDLQRLFTTTGTLILLPILLERKLLGFVLVGERPDGTAFRKTDLELLRTLSGHLAVARENTLLLDRTRRQDRLERELEIAAQIQRHFLPATLAATDWYELAVHYLPAREVGGDMYDIFQEESGSLTVIAGDVSGKGIPAALFGAVSAGLFKAGAAMSGRPAAVLGEINNRLLKIRFSRLNLALCCARFRKNGPAVLANAGFPFPLLIRGKDVRFLETGGLPLAVRRDTEYEELSVTCKPGDLFLFYSDGVPEATDRSRAILGFDGLLRACAAAPRENAAAFLDAITTALSRHTRDREQQDDLTLLVLKIRDAGPT